MKRINFDENATTLPMRCVLRALRRFYRKGYSNPSSLYKSGREAQNIVQMAREKVARALDCNSDEIFFTSGASESNSWVAKNFNLNIEAGSHHSTVEAGKAQNPMDNIEKPTLYSYPYVVSETGKISDDKYFQGIFGNKMMYFVDLTQAVGKVPIHLKKHPNIVCASASGHKFGGILGCGILYIKKDFQQYFKPLIYGSQERGFRGGTENIPAILAFGIAIEKVTKDWHKNNRKFNKLIDYMYWKIELLGLKKVLCGTPRLIIHMMQKDKNGRRIIVNRNTNVLNITFKYLSAQSAVQIFDKYGINISAGSACNSGEDTPSAAYLKAGYTADEALRTVRISVGSNNTMREAKKFIRIFKKVIDKYDNQC